MVTNNNNKRSPIIESYGKSKDDCENSIQQKHP